MTVTNKTPLARLLFEHGLTVREAAALFRCSRSAISNYANATRSPEGETRDLIARVLLGEVTIQELRAGVAPGGRAAGGRRGQTAAGGVLGSPPAASLSGDRA